MWNKKYDEFALTCKLRPSTNLLLRWILRRAKLNEICEIEINLKQFNTWVAKKRGKEFDRKTLREAIAQLDERTQGLIIVAKEYTPWVKKLIVRPLSFVSQEKFPKTGQTPKANNGNPMFDKAHKERLDRQQQQNISKIDSLFQKVGLTYDADALNRIWRLAGKSLENIVNAVELMLHRHSSKPVKSPHGFIIDCLKNNWQKGFDLYYQPELPKFTTNKELIAFCSQLKVT